MGPDDESTVDFAICEAPTDTSHDPEPATVQERPAGRESRPSSLSERYRIGKQIGKGGMGEVMRARDQQLDRDVAIKRMRGAGSEHELRRFVREARIQGRLDHPAILPVHELATDAEGRPYFVMRELAGVTLRGLLDRGAPRQRLLRALADVCLAVEYAHTRGIIHRDLKPANIMLGEFGEVYVIDWGIARVRGEPDDDALLIEPDDDAFATQPGAMIGTPGYMPPEQVQAKALDHRADVYALGCILFEILTGTPMHPAGLAGLESALLGSSRASAITEVPPELDELCARATAPDRAARLATARELGEGIQRFLDGDRDLALRAKLATAHLEVARARFAEPDLDSRAHAMREAGRALALDPTNAGAAALVSRIMIEPPAETPPVVEAELRGFDDAMTRRHGRFVATMYPAYFTFVPGMAWIGITDGRYVAAFVVALAATIALAFALRQVGSSRRLHLAWMIAVSCFILVCSRIFTPPMLAPAIAIVAIMFTARHPLVDQRRMIALTAMFVLGTFGPQLAVWLGWWSETIHWTADGLVIGSPALDYTNRAVIEISYIMFISAIYAASAMTSYNLSHSERVLRRRLQIQAWQLRQLVT